MPGVPIPVHELSMGSLLSDETEARRSLPSPLDLQQGRSRFPSPPPPDLTALGGTMFVSVADTEVETKFSWETPTYLPIPSGDRRRQPRSGGSTSTLASTSLPMLVSGRSRTVADLGQVGTSADNDSLGTASTGDHTRQQRQQSSVTEAVDFASGQAPGSHQWHSLGVVKPSREVAALRKDTLRLELALRDAMSVLPAPSPALSNPKAKANAFSAGRSPAGRNGADGGAAAGRKLHETAGVGSFSESSASKGRLLQYGSELLAMEVSSAEALAARFPLAQRTVQDVLTLQTQLQQTHQRTRQRSPKGGDKRKGNEEQNGDDDDDGLAPDSMLLVASEVGGTLNKQSWDALAKALARSSYEQKQLDLTAGELAEQVSTLSHEQARLLQTLRAGHGFLAARVSADLVHGSLELLEASLGALKQSRVSEATLKREHETYRAEHLLATKVLEREFACRTKLRDEAFGLEKAVRVREAAKQLSSLRVLQASLKDAQRDSTGKDAMDLRAEVAKLRKQLNTKDEELAGLQSMRDMASQTGVMEKYAKNALAEVKRLQKELKERDDLLAGLLERDADERFARCADAATAAERAVTTLASVDPCADGDLLLPAAVPVRGSVLCVRCERSLNSVMSSEADVRRADALEKARPCRGFVQLLGPVPRGLRLLAPRPPSKKKKQQQQQQQQRQEVQPQEGNEDSNKNKKGNSGSGDSEASTAEDEGAAAAAAAGNGDSVAHELPLDESKLLDLWGQELDEEETESSFQKERARALAVDKGAPGPFSLRSLRRMLASAPAGRFRRTSVALLAYPDWRRFTPEALAKTPDSDGEEEDDEGEGGGGEGGGASSHDPPHWPPYQGAALYAAQKAESVGCAAAIRPEVRFVEAESSVSVFHGASPWWVRLCMRAILWAKIEDQSLAEVGRQSNGGPRFADFVWAWFEPGEEMRNAYYRHRLDQKRQAEEASAEAAANAAGGSGAAAAAQKKKKKGASPVSAGGGGGVGGFLTGGAVPAVPELSELAEARRWLFFDGLRRLACAGGASDVNEDAAGPTARGGGGVKPATAGGGKAAREAAAAAQAQARSEAVGKRALRAKRALERKAKEPDPEAATFWTLLDGRCGSDYERFAIHALECLEGAFPAHDGRLRVALGPCTASPDVSSLVEQAIELEAECAHAGNTEAAAVAAAGLSGGGVGAGERVVSVSSSGAASSAAAAASEGGGSGSGGGGLAYPLPCPSLAASVCPPRVWAPVWAVMKASRLLLSKAPPVLRDRVLGTLPGLGVESGGRLAPRPLRFHNNQNSSSSSSSSSGVSSSVNTPAQSQQQEPVMVVNPIDVAYGAAEEESSLSGEEVEKAVDVFLWVKIMLRCFKEEQLNREVVVRAMFSTAQASNRSKDRVRNAATATANNKAGSSLASASLEGDDEYDQSSLAGGGGGGDEQEEHEDGDGDDGDDNLSLASGGSRGGGSRGSLATGRGGGSRGSVAGGNGNNSGAAVAVAVVVGSYPAPPPPKLNPSTMVTASQCVSVAKALDPFCTTARAVSLYRTAAELGAVSPTADDLKGVPLRAVPVTPDLFLKACEAHGFMASALDLPGHGSSSLSHKRSAELEHLDARGSKAVGSFVHLRLSLLSPYLASTLARLPEASKACLTHAVRDVRHALGQASPALFGSDPATRSRARKKGGGKKKAAAEQQKAMSGGDQESKGGNSAAADNNGDTNAPGGGGGTVAGVAVAELSPPNPSLFPGGVVPTVSVDGSVALVAFRRLLALLLKHRHWALETGRVGVFPFTDTAWQAPASYSTNKDHHGVSAGGGLHVGGLHRLQEAPTASERRAVQRIFNELASMESAVFPQGCVPLIDAKAPRSALVKTAANSTTLARAAAQVSKSGHNNGTSGDGGGGGGGASSYAAVLQLQLPHLSPSSSQGGSNADPRLRLLPLQRKVAAQRVTLWWRRRLGLAALREHLPPLQILAALTTTLGARAVSSRVLAGAGPAAAASRGGYLAGGGGGLKARRMHWPPALTTSTVAACLGAWLALPHSAATTTTTPESASTAPPTAAAVATTSRTSRSGFLVNSNSNSQSLSVSLADVVRQHALRLFGLPVLADRWVVDLCFNAAHLQQWLPRCRAFGLFLGGLGFSSESAGFAQAEVAGHEASVALKQKQAAAEEHPLKASKRAKAAANDAAKLAKLTKADGTLFGAASKAEKASVLEQEVKRCSAAAALFFAKAARAAANAQRQHLVTAAFVERLASSVAGEVCQEVPQALNDMLARKEVVAAEAAAAAGRKKRKAKPQTADQQAEALRSVAREAERLQVLAGKCKTEASKAVPCDLFPATVLETTAVWGRRDPHPSSGSASRVSKEATTAATSTAGGGVGTPLNESGGSSRCSDESEEGPVLRGEGGAVATTSPAASKKAKRRASRMSVSGAQGEGSSNLAVAAAATAAAAIAAAESEKHNRFSMRFVNLHTHGGVGTLASVLNSGGAAAAAGVGLDEQRDSGAFGWWRVSRGSLYGEAAVTSLERSRCFGGQWRNRSYGVGRRGSVLHALLDLFFPEVVATAAQWNSANSAEENGEEEGVNLDEEARAEAWAFKNAKKNALEAFGKKRAAERAKLAEAEESANKASSPSRRGKKDGNPPKAVNPDDDTAAEAATTGDGSNGGGPGGRRKYSQLSGWERRLPEWGAGLPGLGLRGRGGVGGGLGAPSDPRRLLEQRLVARIEALPSWDRGEWVVERPGFSGGGGGHWREGGASNTVDGDEVLWAVLCEWAEQRRALRLLGARALRAATGSAAAAAASGGGEQLTHVSSGGGVSSRLANTGGHLASPSVAGALVIGKAAAAALAAGQQAFAADMLVAWAVGKPGNAAAGSGGKSKGRKKQGAAAATAGKSDADPLFAAVQFSLVEEASNGVWDASLAEDGAAAAAAAVGGRGQHLSSLSPDSFLSSSMLAMVQCAGASNADSWSRAASLKAAAVTLSSISATTTAAAVTRTVVPGPVPPRLASPLHLSLAVRQVWVLYEAPLRKHLLTLLQEARQRAKAASEQRENVWRVNGSSSSGARHGGADEGGLEGPLSVAMPFDCFGLEPTQDVGSAEAFLSVSGRPACEDASSGESSVEALKWCVLELEHCARQLAALGVVEGNKGADDGSGLGGGGHSGVGDNGGGSSKKGPSAALAALEDARQAMNDVVSARTKGLKPKSQVGKAEEKGGERDAKEDKKRGLLSPPPLTALQDFAKQRRKAENADAGLEAAWARVRRLFANVVAAQDRVAVASQRGGGSFVRDAWASGSKPKQPDRGRSLGLLVGAAATAAKTTTPAGPPGSGGNILTTEKVKFPEAGAVLGLSAQLLLGDSGAAVE